MNFGIIVAIGAFIVVTRLASWAQKQQRISQGRLPPPRDDARRPEGLLDVLKDLDRQLGQAPGQTVQTRMPAPRPAVTSAVRGLGGAARSGPLGEPLDANQGGLGPLGESLGARSGATGPLGEPLGPQGRFAAEVLARPVGMGTGLPTRVPGQVPALRGETPASGQVQKVRKVREALAAKQAASAKAPAGTAPVAGTLPAQAQAVKIAHPKAEDPAAGGRRLAHALLQTNDGRQAAMILTEIFGPPVSRR